MIAITALILGFSVAGLKSLSSYGIASFLLLTSFAATFVTPGAHAPFSDLAIAILSYNAGILCLLIGTGIGLHILGKSTVDTQ
jgi:hypothetical protein